MSNGRDSLLGPVIQWCWVVAETRAMSVYNAACLPRVAGEKVCSVGWGSADRLQTLESRQSR